MNATPAHSIVGRHFRSGRPVQVDVADGRIVAVAELPDAAAPRSVPWIAPGLVDVQVNGYGGQEFSSPELTAERVIDITRRQVAFGVTRYLPTLTTADRSTILHGLQTIAAARRADAQTAHVVAGVHLEGPYIGREDGPRGAHPLAHCRPPDEAEFALFQEAAEGQIRLVTLSPEYPAAAAFIRRVSDQGVVVAIGHTAANSEQIRAAVDAGARLSTHLGNGAHRTLRRHPNYLWDQLAEDRLMASLIVDGHHLPPEVVQTMVRAKTPARCILISDLSGLAGLPPGRYDTQLCELEILADGRLVIAGQDQLLAGASRPLGAGVANVVRFAGVGLAEAIDMASRQPAELLGLAPAALEPGAAADLTLFDIVESEGAAPQFVLRATFLQGRPQPPAAD